MLPSSSEASSEAAGWQLDIVSFVDVVIEPGSPACSPLFRPSSLGGAQPALASPGLSFQITPRDATEGQTS